MQHFVGSIPWSAIACGALARPLTKQSNRADTGVCVRYYLFVDSACRYLTSFASFSANAYIQSPSNKEIVNRRALF
jgi:hypothetical protein